jgi:hypothetical protein
MIELDTFFSRMMAIVNKIQTHDDKMDDITIIEKIHISLTLKCHFIVDEHESNT